MAFVIIMAGGSQTYWNHLAGYQKHGGQAGCFLFVCLFVCLFL